MGAFDTINDIAIPDDSNLEEATAFRKQWKWDAHEIIFIRGTYTAADQEIVENASASVERNGKKSSLKLNSGTARRKLLERMIVKWTLTDRGIPVPVTPETIGKLPSNYRTPVLEKIDEVSGGMDEEEQEELLTSASEPTGASSETMNLSQSLS